MSNIDPWWRDSTHDEENRKFDKLSHSVTTITEQHRLVHDGMYFIVSGKQTGLVNGGTTEFLVSPPADCFPHIQTMVLNFGRGDVDFEAYEGPTITDNGTPIPAQNVNRNSSITPELNLYANPTTTDDGSQEFQLWVPPTATGTGQSANGIEGLGNANEWVLAPETPWLIRITNNSGATIDWSYQFAWYEVSYPS